MSNTDYDIMQETLEFLENTIRSGDGFTETVMLYSSDGLEALARIRAEHERLREALRATRDWIRYAANSDGGIVVQTIDNALGEKP